MPVGLKGWAMNYIFWLGIAVGGIISLLASIAANLFQARIINFLEGRKLDFRERRFKNARRLHRIILKLHSGKRDKYMYALRLTMLVGVCITSSIVAIAAGVVILVLGISPNALFALSDPVAVLRVLCVFVFLFLSMFCTFTGVRAQQRLSAIQDGLDNFAEYEADFKKKWGDAGIETTASS
jgi:hypothetical protein